jgi:transcriptional regulator with XRE-family HTH domain
MDRVKSIKIALVRAGITQTEIANKHNVTRSLVSQVIHGISKSQRIQKELDEILRHWGKAI